MTFGRSITPPRGTGSGPLKTAREAASTSQRPPSFVFLWDDEVGARSFEPLGRRVAYGLDVVAVGVLDVRGVIARVIVLADARRTVVAPAGCNRRVVEGIDQRPIGSVEGHVPPTDWVAAHDAEARHLTVPEAEELTYLELEGIAERLQRLGVELLAHLQVGHVH